MRHFCLQSGLVVLGIACVGPAMAHAAEYITLKNGQNVLCDHRQADGDQVRLYLDDSTGSYLEVKASDIASAQVVNLLRPPAKTSVPAAAPSAGPEKLSDTDLRPMLAKAGAAFDIDTDLLASVIRQESGGHARAVSRAGAEGLMQLMPGTASQLGVNNSFAPRQNIDGGTAYLDVLLTKYHDDLALALAAFNAGPAAVDRWHGIPPYRETQLYVARVIHEYNRRYRLRQVAEQRASRQMAALPRQAQ
ncbi:MAG TPA: lytic transglycosylase domain-containing protein [Acidobacteriaceae bacterium]|jgi:soluble lytic murein transglycosylase-like protein|nr:lytic transglycosylase domain-containing protein [Acidobacteriaceae bacterium]